MLDPETAITEDSEMEIKATLCGIPGTLTVVPWGKGGRDGKQGLFMHQKWVSERRTKTVKGQKVLMHAEVRFDDNCKNGHNSFAVTGTGWYDNWKSRDCDFCGCCHEEIEKVFPELKHLIKWHLMSSDSPMHYVSNTVYHASNLHNGLVKGEPNSWENRLKFGAFPITFSLDKAFLTWLVAALKHRATTPSSNPDRPKFDVVEVQYVKRTGESYNYSPNYSLDGYTDTWHVAPFKNKRDAEEFSEALRVYERDVEVVSIVTGYSPGKERDFDAARSCGIWPDATDEQLSLPKDELTALLNERLPAMVAEFKAAIASTGCFEWEAPADA
jgi:hypothetical protein